MITLDPVAAGELAESILRAVRGLIPPVGGPQATAPGRHAQGYTINNGQAPAR